MQNPNFEAQPGDILYGTNNKNSAKSAPHFIIYLGPSDHPTEHFYGAMLTSSPFYGNIPLSKAHFESANPEGNAWRIQYQDEKGSFIPNQLFHKFVDWHPFELVGRLSPEGLLFIKKQLNGKIPVISSLNARKQ